MSEVIIRPIDIERDAEGLAAMWNASDLQWPGGWTDGLPFTVQDIHEMEEEERNLVVYVAEVDGEIAGYCSFDGGHHGPDNEGYLGLLNVHPKYQKQSVGRKLIQVTIDRAVQEGWPRQTLGTWSANFKSVPAYKKTGHFWRPGTSVWMQNFIPGALQMPIAKPFFERHNWYQSYVRALEQCEDDERWEGLKVYTMRWQAEGEALTIWIDREALAPTAVETDQMLLAAIPSEIEPLNGSETALHWRVGNKTDEPLHVHIRALGADGLAIDHHEALVAPPHSTVEHVTQVKVGPEAPRGKEYGVAPTVRTIFTIDHLDVELASGLRPRKPLSLDSEPGQISLIPGVTGQAALQLHNETAAPVAGVVHLTLPAGLAADWVRHEVDVPAKGHASLPLRLTANCAGALTLNALWAPADDKRTPVNEAIAVFSVGLGGLVAQQQGKDVRIETDTLRVGVRAREGGAAITLKETDDTLTRFGETIGPPYWPNVFRETDMEVFLEQHDGRAVVHTWAESNRYKGLVLHRLLTVTASGAVMVRSYFENRSAVAYRRRIRLSFQLWERSKMRLAAPLRGGIVYESTSLYPQTRRDLPTKAAEFDEPWLAVEYEGRVLGLSWDEGVEQFHMGWWGNLVSREVSVEPGQRAEIMSFSFCAGAGDWRSVRAMARRWRGEEHVKAATPPVRLAAQAEVQPRVLTTVSHIAEGRLVVDSAAIRPMDGQARLELPAGVSAQPAQVAVHGLTRAAAIEQPVRITLPADKLGVWRGVAQLDLPILGGARPLAIVRVGNNHAVTVHSEERQGQTVWVVDNGTHRFTVAPSFGPSLISWVRNGVEQIHSYFPTKQGLAWFYPMFGGIQPLFSLQGDNDNNDMDYLHREVFAAEPLVARDEAGIAWQGVRLSARLTKEEWRDFALEIDWLTVGASPLIKFVYRVRNLRPTAQRARVHAYIIASLGVAPVALTLHSEAARRQPTTWQSFADGTRWALVTHPASGASLVAMSAEPCVSPVDLGQNGRMLGLGKTLRLAGEASQEMAAYLALGDSPDEALQYRALVEL